MFNFSSTFTRGLQGTGRAGLRPAMGSETRTAFVTGATRFIGLAVVEALLKHGWRVVVLSRSERSALAALKDVEGGEKVTESARSCSYYSG